MSVGTFDPGAAGDPPATLAPADLARLLAAAGDLDADRLGLSDHEVARLGRVARTDALDWAAVAAPLADADLVQLIRVLVLAEVRLPEFESGARSPVVPLARTLRQRDAYPAELTAWIREQSSNRFLPHGSLMDRL
ncbi:MAG: hypothetical protein AAGI15_01550 [Pseudomonadota bacterium]